MSARWRYRSRAGLLLAALLLASSANVDAHLVVSRRSLRMLVADADAVVRARLLAVDEVIAAGGDPSSQRPTLRVKVIEVLKGPATRGDVSRVAQKGHGVPHYGVGDEALLFLRHLSRSEELDGLGVDGELRWYSNQEHDDDWLLTPQSAQSTVRVARRYVAIEEMLPGERDAAMNRLTVRLLRSRDERLARSALRDLTMQGGSASLTRGDVEPLLRVVHDPTRPIDLRVALLAELQRRGQVQGDSHWAKLLRSTRGGDRLAVIPAAGLRLGPKSRAELEKLVAGSDIPVAAAAAVALGNPGDEAAVLPLSSALRSEDRRLAMAAVRALGRVGTSDARAAIERAAKTHPDSSVRRRADAELELMSAR